jgi:hypothetical protein
MRTQDGGVITQSSKIDIAAFSLRNSQSVILGSSDRAKDLLPIYVFPQLLPRRPSRGFLLPMPQKERPAEAGQERCCVPRVSPNQT